MSPNPNSNLPMHVGGMPARPLLAVNVLGFDAVTRQRQIDATASTAGTGPVAGETNWKIIYARYRVANLSPYSQYELERYVSHGAPDMYDEQATEAARRNIPWFQWIARDEPRAEKDLMNTLEWHVRNLETLRQSSEVEWVISYEKEKAQQTVREGIAAKWLSEKAVEAIPRIDITDVLLSDPFDPVIAEGTIAYHPKDEDVAVIGTAPDDQVAQRWRGMNAITFTQEALETALGHELGHSAVSTKGKNAEDGRQHNGTFEENGAAHFGVVSKYGNPETLDPHAREGDEQGWDERHLYSQILKAPGGTIPVADMMRAFSGTTDEKTAFEKKLDAGWRIDGTMQRLAEAERKAKEKVRRQPYFDGPVLHNETVTEIMQRTLVRWREQAG